MYFTTPSVQEEIAKIQGKVSLINDTICNTNVGIKIDLIDPEGTIVQSLDKKKLIFAEEEGEVEVEFLLKEPKLWDIYNGQLYTICVSLIVNGEMIQTEKIRIGIRSFRFDVNEGFFLNERNVLIKGVVITSYSIHYTKLYDERMDLFQIM